MQDATHFFLRTVISIGEIRGHANLAMELRESVQPSLVEYCGHGIIAGSDLRLNILFRITKESESTLVQWQGEVSLSGFLAVMGGELLETKGRQDFITMAERLRTVLTPSSSPTADAMGSIPLDTDI
jgi:carbon monoxide dehydrogenase subunit G